ncbi:hypothetical protein LCGC14_0784430 [marine sediment metagenome]|uniref:Uncharacterized protein n=1 Tax=marine sediment metagenome TaxID=412755 RepID=A0A0F9PYS1_9ZZZZ|nr:hypothetical protein [Phycisphaerae bacterium]
MSGYMRRVGPGLGQDNGDEDVTVQALQFPAWVPKLTEPTQQVAGGTYISVHDYNLLIARANTRTMTNTAVGVGVGLFIGWALVRAYRR